MTSSLHAGDETIKVLVADNNLVFLQSVTVLIQEHKELSLAGMASDGQEAIHLAKVLQPDVVVLDLNMPGMHGMRAIPEIRQVAPSAKIIVLTFYAEDDNRALAQAAGAAAFIAKSDTDAQLVSAIMKLGRSKPSLSS